MSTFDLVLLLIIANAVQNAKVWGPAPGARRVATEGGRHHSARRAGVDGVGRERKPHLSRSARHAAADVDLAHSLLYRGLRDRGGADPSCPLRAGGRRDHP